MSEIDEKEIKRRFEVISQFEPSSEVTARDVERAKERLTEHMSGQQPREQKIWRIIMKSKITKLAAAAVIIVAVILGLTITGGPEIASVSWAEVIEKVEQIPALSFDMTTEISYTENKKLSLQSENCVAGDYGTKSSIYMNGELFVLKYRLPKKNLAYQIRPKDKTYFRFDLSDEQAAKGQDPDDPRTWLKMILSGDYTKLGHTKINDIDVEGIESSNPEIVGGDEVVMRLWVNVETNLPVRIEVEGEKMEGGQKRPHKFVMENFQWNVELDESVFEPNIPDDYTMMEVPNRQEINPQSKESSDEDATEKEMAKEAAKALFQACAGQDWDEVSKFLPNTKINQQLKNVLGGLETIFIGEPFRANKFSGWCVPYEIKFKSGNTQRHTLELRKDKPTNRYIVLGGF